ncbi:hypothetical protein Pelo_4432 [Pelomyxa schiedti]|nr:hypothetical protein Pelo_4432 [Pelomyxa schiedti]
MKRVPGHSFEYKPGVTIWEDFGDTVTDTTTSSSATPGASYNDGPLKHLGPGYESVIAPGRCPPARWPSPPAAPWRLAAQGSGGGKMEWFRLKGCGDLYLGFPVIGVDNTAYVQIENLNIAPFKEMFPPERINGGEVEPTETPTLAAQDQLCDFTTKPLSLHAVPFPAILNTKWQTLWAECNAKLPTGPTMALTYLYWRDATFPHPIDGSLDAQAEALVMFTVTYIA